MNATYQWLKEHPAWHKWLVHIEALCGSNKRDLTKKIVKARIAAAKASQRVHKLEQECRHPKGQTVLSIDGCKDDYGCYMDSSDYSIFCNACSRYLKYGHEDGQGNIT